MIGKVNNVVYFYNEGGITPLDFMDNGFTSGKEGRNHLPYWKNDNLTFNLDYVVKKV